MKFYIVTPSYNCIKFLPGAVYSVRNQLFSCDSGHVTKFNVHHHVQDGGSTDGTVKWLREYQDDPGNQNNHECGMSAECLQNYSFSFSSEHDEGMYDAINRGWARGASDADIVAWINCDEQFLPGALGRVTNFLKRHPRKDAVFGSLILVDKKGDPIAARRENIPLRKRYLLYGPLYAMTCTLFFRSKLWKQGDLKLNTKYRIVADADLVLRLLEENVEFGYINDYQALFTVMTGENLSCQGQNETLAMQKEHGRKESMALAKVVLAQKYLEKLMAGSYRKSDLEYQWFNNSGESIAKRANGVGFRFKGHWDRSPDVWIGK